MHKKITFSEGNTKIFLYTLAKKICPLDLNLWGFDTFVKVAELH